MLGVMRETFEAELESMRGVDDFFSVASTMPLAALMPREVTPWLTALRAYSGKGRCEYLPGSGGGTGVEMYLFAPAYRCRGVSEGMVDWENWRKQLTWARRW